MGIIDAAFDSFGGMLQDQWKDIVTAGSFDERTIVAPGVRKRSQNGRGNNFGAEDIISNGSMIFVPENTAAFVFSQAGIEQVITQPGGYEYRNGEATVFDAQDRQSEGVAKILLGQAANRIGFSGMSQEEKRVAFVNLREMRGIKFGTRGPLTYNDLIYGTDLEVFSYGTFTVQVSDPVRFVREFLPPNTSSYSLDNPKAREQLLAEFLHSFIAAVNSLSSTYRISQLPAQTDEIAKVIAADDGNASTWDQRFGLKLVSVAIENIEFSDESRELVRRYSERKMSVAAYEGVSQQAANMAAQQMIAEGVRDNGLGDGGGMLFGMNLAGALDPSNASRTIPHGYGSVGGGTGGAGGSTVSANGGSSDEANDGNPSSGTISGGSGTISGGSANGAGSSLDSQIETLKKLKDLLDAGILSQEEFDAKKREVLGP